MELVNEKLFIEIEPLTPLSVGAGSENDWSEGVDYIVQDGDIYLLDLQKMIQEGIDVSRLSALFAAHDGYGVKTLIGNKLQKVFSKKMKLPCATSNDIKTMVKSQLHGNPIIPGSSIKGSIRSVLYDYLGVNGGQEDLAFGTLKDGKSFMRFIKVGDVDFEDSVLVNTKIFNLCQEDGNGWQGGWKHGGRETTPSFRPQGFNTVYECLVPGMKGMGTLMLSPLQFSHVDGQPKQNEKKLLMDGGYKALFRLINQHTKEYLVKERAFFAKFSTGETGAILESIDQIMQTIPTDDSCCVFKMSAGSGFHSITGDWQFDDYTTGQLGRRGNTHALPKSRKIALWKNRFDMMGFVKMSVISQEAYTKWVEERASKAIQSELNELVAAINKCRNQDIEKAYDLIRRIKVLSKDNADEIPHLNEFVTAYTQYLQLVEDATKALQNNIQEAFDAVCQAKNLSPAFESSPLFKEVMGLYDKYSTLVQEAERERSSDIEKAYQVVQKARVVSAAFVCPLFDKIAQDYEFYCERVKIANENKESDIEKSYKAIQDAKSLSPAYILDPLCVEIESLYQKWKVLSGGLSQLLDCTYQQGPKVGQYMVESFKVCQQKVEKWLKEAALAMLPQEQLQPFEATLRRLYAKPDKKEIKEWTNQDSNLWKKVASWVGTDLATKWYQGIVS